MRLELLDQIAQHCVDFTKALWKMFGPFARGAQRAEAEHSAAASIAFDHAISGGSRRGGIDAENAEKIGRGSRGWLHGIECTVVRRARPQFFHCGVHEREEEQENKK